MPALPFAFASFARDILFSEIVIYLVVYFLIGLMGVAIGIFFNLHILSTEMATLAHILVLSVIIVPLNVIFSNIPIVVYAYYLLPPVNFLAHRLSNLGDGAFAIDANFLIFVVWSLGYALVLMALYSITIQRKNKR